MIWQACEGVKVNQQFKIINEDCLEAMKRMEDGTVDAIVTDPPYGLSFMGAKWDSMVAYQERMTPIFEEALRVAKPGAHMLCFGGTRTFHRLACAIEDAGWEVRDTIMWVYGCLDEETENAMQKVLAFGNEGKYPVVITLNNLDFKFLRNENGSIITNLNFERKSYRYLKPIIFES